MSVGYLPPIAEGHGVVPPVSDKIEAHVPMLEGQLQQLVGVLVVGLPTGPFLPTLELPLRILGLVSVSLRTSRSARLPDDDAAGAAAPTMSSDSSESVCAWS